MVDSSILVGVDNDKNEQMNWKGGYFVYVFIPDSPIQVIRCSASAVKSVMVTTLRVY